MDVFVITTEREPPYDDQVYHAVDSVHATEESANKRLDEIKKESTRKRGVFYGECELFVVQE